MPKVSCHRRAFPPTVDLPRPASCRRVRSVGAPTEHSTRGPPCKLASRRGRGRGPGLSAAERRASQTASRHQSGGRGIQRKMSSPEPEARNLRRPRPLQRILVLYRYWQRRCQQQARLEDESGQFRRRRQAPRSNLKPPNARTDWAHGPAHPWAEATGRPCAAVRLHASCHFPGGGGGGGGGFLHRDGGEMRCDEMEMRWDGRARETDPPRCAMPPFALLLSRLPSPAAAVAGKARPGRARPSKVPTQERRLAITASLEPSPRCTGRAQRSMWLGRAGEWRSPPLLSSRSSASQSHSQSRSPSSWPGLAWPRVRLSFPFPSRPQNVGFRASLVSDSSCLCCTVKRAVVMVDEVHTCSRGTEEGERAPRFTHRGDGILPLPPRSLN